MVDITLEENQAVFDGPALSSNRIIVHNLGGSIRLSFLELYAT